MNAYVLRLLCGAVVCALIRSICDRQIVKLLCGAYLAGLALSPVAQLEWELPDLDAIRREAQAAVSDGTRQAESAQDAIIKERCEAYILDEAAVLGLRLTVEVDVAQGKPAAAIMTGDVGAGDRQILSTQIARNLGIGKEAQTWFASYQSSLPP